MNVRRTIERDCKPDEMGIRREIFVSQFTESASTILFRQKRRFNCRPQFQDRQQPHPLTSRRTVRRRHYRQIIKYQKTTRSAAGVEPTTFRTAATDNDKG